VLALVVCWDGDINELQWRVGIAESNDWDVDIAGLADSLVINSGVGDNNESGLLEGSGNVICE
jgi:hypothetical protein